MNVHGLDGYWVLIARDHTKEKGPGTAFLMLGDSILDSWDVITGGSELNPKAYGGITPPILWRMVERIEKRRHPKGHTMTMARLYPWLEEQKEEYVPPRTVDLEGVPFMTHGMGWSSGCVGPDYSELDSYAEALNDAFDMNDGQLIFDVRDEVM